MPSNKEILEQVDRVIQKGWYPVPVTFKGKLPVGDDWNKPGDPEEVRKRWERDNLNLGILLGSTSGGLVDVDLDSPEAARLAPRFMPPTKGVFGREGNPRSHYTYITLPFAQTRKFSDPVSKKSGKRAMLLELRSDGHQTVFPPSVHETGESIRFEDHGDENGLDVPEIEVDVLYAAVSKLAAAALIGRYWSAGARHESAMALAGMLCRIKWTEEQILFFIEAVCDVSGDEEKGDRLRAVKDTLRRAARGMKFTGAAKLAEYLPEEVVLQVKSFLGTAEEDHISELNEEFAVVLIGNKAAVLKRAFDPTYDRERYDFLSVADFKTWMCNKFVQIPGKKEGEVKWVPVAEAWLTSRNRTTYDQVIFSPDRDVSGALNLWQGFSTKPREGDCTKFLHHVKENVCGGVEEHYEWVLSFIADLFQNPGRRPGVALVLRGKRGTGKGVFANQIGKMCQPHYIQVSHPRHLTGNFNSHLRDALLVFADEAFYAGDKAHAGVLKAMITEPDINVEMKGKDVFSVSNYIRLIIASNEAWVIPAGMDERRFAVFDVQEKFMQNHDYFGAILEEMDGGGREALMDLLLKRDLSEVNLRKIPDTAALVEQKITTASPVEQWYLARLMEGNIVPRAQSWGRIPEDEPWPEWVAKDAVYEDYRGVAQDAGVFRRGQVVQFWMELAKIMPPGRVKEQARMVYAVLGKGEDAAPVKIRKVFIKLLPLEACRDKFAELMRTEIEWPEVQPEGEEKY